MATKRMLVDAIHPEETRIVVTDGNRLEEFDFESATRRQLRGNIYLAKVTRVEPSLQAAFIEYGGNRHGFLAFSEIHPDYYQIPVADREALLRDEEEHDRAHNDAAEPAEIAAAAAPAESVSEDAGEPEDAEADAAESATAEADAEGENGHDHSHITETPADTEPVESVGGGDALEEMPERRRTSTFRRNYKIQEVIKRRQVMLVQVVKEERGNKGAALTTYLSLAGRYSVLMPNTARGGGISRKITNAADRKRLKDIVGDLDIPPGQGIILRTAGASRTKAEVKRDFEYLQRLWENVRSLTLRSQAPCLVYEEGSLIKRTIRDLYNKEVDELYVAGEDAFAEAKEFMRMIMPSHAKNVQLYKDEQPIFSKYGVEPQLDQMFSPQVTLPSGGYIVINPTEALVSIDVNSGRSTKEHNIEDTALQTNLEASDEIARQLRLRDLAGLIVIDFIDMMENRSNRAVERRLKDALKNDRARIQVGRISHFGLMEMSRQRIRFGVVESSTHTCPICQGTGLVRSVESLALMVMRATEDHVMRKPGNSINVRVPTPVALYILNSKRNSLASLEVRYDLSITLVADDHLAGSQYVIERGEARPNRGLDLPAPAHVRVDSASMDEVEDEPEAEAEVEDEVDAEAADAAAGEGSQDKQGRRRRRRGRRGAADEAVRPPQRTVAAPVIDEDLDAPASATDDEEDDEEAPVANGQLARAAQDDEHRKRRRRGRRGGRRNRRGPGENGDSADGTIAASDRADGALADEADADSASEPVHVTAVATVDIAVEPPADASDGPDHVLESEPAQVTVEPEVAAKPKRTRKPKADSAPKAEAKPKPAAEAAAEPETPKPARRRRKAAEPDASADPAAAAATAETAPATADGDSAGADSSAAEPAPEPASTEPAQPPKPKRVGWWQRGFLGG